MLQIDQMQNALAPLKEQLVHHALYQHIDSVENIQVFMQMHVFAVWDFMSLLKSLQKALTSVDIPWIPSQNTKIRRLINEIVLCEESDYTQDGRTMSHFEMYLDAMKQVQCDTSVIDEFIMRLSKGESVTKALSLESIDNQVREFVEFTFDVIESGKLHLIASIFTFGRENLIPDMFIELVRKFNHHPKANLDQLIYYLERHIEVDGEEHGPMALEMIIQLCGQDNEKWKEAIETCQMALKKRIQLWDAIDQTILRNRYTTN